MAAHAPSLLIRANQNTCTSATGGARVGPSLETSLASLASLTSKPQSPQTTSAIMGLTQKYDREGPAPAAVALRQASKANTWDLSDGGGNGYSDPGAWRL